MFQILKISFSSSSWIADENSRVRLLRSRYNRLVFVEEIIWIGKLLFSKGPTSGWTGRCTISLCDQSHSASLVHKERNRGRLSLLAVRNICLGYGKAISGQSHSRTNSQYSCSLLLPGKTSNTCIITNSAVCFNRMIGQNPFKGPLIRPLSIPELVLKWSLIGIFKFW